MRSNEWRSATGVVAALVVSSQCTATQPRARVGPVPPEVRGAWTTIPLLETRRFHTATPLGDGRVLVVGGEDPAVVSRTSGLLTTEIYDPSQRRFLRGPELPDARVWHAAARVGTFVLVAGGLLSLSSALLVDQVTTELRPTGPMLIGRQNFEVVSLLDGTALVFGGGGRDRHQFAEAYDPQRQSFSRVGDIVVPRFDCPATVLRDGRVLLTGGVSAAQASYNERLADAELYEPSTRQFFKTGSMKHARSEHTATLLEDGKVLVAGGHTDTAELYDPERGTFREIASLRSPRSDHAAVRLLDGRVLIVGGATYIRGKDGILKTAEVFDPATERFFPSPPMSVERQGHTATLLKNGEVLVVGGWTGIPPGSTTAEVFSLLP